MKKGLEYFVIAGMIILIASVYIHEMVHVWQFKQTFGTDSDIYFGTGTNNNTFVLFSPVAYVKPVNWDSKNTVEYNQLLPGWELQAYAVQLIFAVGAILVLL